jgi:hypothetical protein
MERVFMKKNTYDWTNLFDKILRLIKVEYESLIAEIVDNSMDNNAENVLIRFSGTRWDDFSATIFDDGTGFESEKELFESFNLAIQDVTENSLGNAKITGINDIGMKLTPLSFCDSITVITRFNNGNMGCRTLSRESATRDDNYETDDTKQEFFTFDPTWKLIENGTWKTAVIIHNHHKEAFSGRPIYIRKYCQNLAKFLGITYNQILDDAEIKLSNINIQHQDEKGFWDKDIIETKSLDPFWSSFTPENIVGRIEKNVYDKFKKKDQNMMRALVEFGTVASKRTSIPIKSEVDGKTHNVKLQAFVLPPREAKKLIPKKYTKNCFDTGISKCGTPILQKVNSAGFYFYRNKRCISFGTSGYAKNKGFYKILTSPDNQQLDIRIKVDFPQQLDKFFDLEPTKNGVTPPDLFFDSVMEELAEPIHDDLLRGNITKSGNRTPFFSFNSNAKNQSTGLDTKCVAQKFVKTAHLKKVIECQYCGFGHHKDTICKMAPKDLPKKTVIPKGKKDSKKIDKKKSTEPTVSKMDHNSSRWTIVLDMNTPVKNREEIKKAIKKFNINLD